MKVNPKKEAPYFMPTEDCPWTVIYYDSALGKWRYLGFRESRKRARDLVAFIRSNQGGEIKARVVRAWIPLR